MSIRKPLLTLGVAGAIALSAAVATPALAQSGAPDIALLPTRAGSGANPPPPMPVAGDIQLDTPATWQGELLTAPLARPVGLLGGD